ncbi:MAG: S-layer homology domain-containing protein [Bacillota bacterium]
MKSFMRNTIRKMNRIGIVAIGCCLSFQTVVFAFSAEEIAELNQAVTDLGAVILEVVPQPKIDSVGGEWAVIGLARSEEAVPETYWNAYYKTVSDTVSAQKGILHDKKYSEYSRVALALTALGKNPSDVGGYDLLLPLGDYEATIWQGMNGPIWALIALDSGAYEIPENDEATTQATRELYLERILDCQLSDGGWSLLGGTELQSENELSDPDLTGMALQALANYKTNADVKSALDKAVAFLSTAQNDDGGFSGADSVESCVQVMVGLLAMDISLEDSRFVKNGNTTLDYLLSHYVENQGFLHTKTDQTVDLMSTEQGFYGLVALQRNLQNKTHLYDMSDVKIVETTTDSENFGLPNVHADVKKMEVQSQNTTYPDIAIDRNRSAIETLANRGIIKGNADGNFYPNNTMTRAEFATLIVNALGLTPTTVEKFSDVKSSDWFAPYVGTAVNYGIVSGTSATTFAPQGTITKQEAAAMVSRAALLCGHDTTFSEKAVQDVLAGFLDYKTVSAWAGESLAFCYDIGILDDGAMDIEPTKNLTRSEISAMVKEMLAVSDLL